MSAAPRRILIIRHAEKPGDPVVDSPSDGAGLSQRGLERAGALAPCLQTAYGALDFLFATQQSAHSCRPIQTITPLANLLGMEIRSAYADADYGSLAAEILGNPACANKQLLICWHHGKIPELTAALGGIPPKPKWPGDAFDRVWLLDYGAGRGKVALKLPVQDLPQRLMYGDSDT